MSDNTPIEWADATVNAINGCSLASPGCTHCYAMKQAHRVEFRRDLVMPTKGGPVWNGKVYLHEPALLQPLKWTRPRRIFWNAHGDTFHDAVPDAWIDRVFAVAALTPQHTHMILTKRSERMREYLTRHRWHYWAACGREIDANRWAKLPPIMGGDCTPVPNVWLGVSVEDQTRADERIPDLLATPAAVRFLSCEPLLGPVDLRQLAVLHYTGGGDFSRQQRDPFLPDGLHWVIAGGENGPRPMHPDWVRFLRDQCAAAGIPFHFKRWGSCLPGNMDGEDEIGRAAYEIEDVAQPVDYDQLGRGRLVQANGDFIRFHHHRTGRMLDGIEHNGLPGAAR